MNLTIPELFFTPVKIFFLTDNFHVKYYYAKFAQECTAIKTYSSTGKTQIINITFQPHQHHQKYLAEFSGISLHYTNSPSDSKSIRLL